MPHKLRRNHLNLEKEYGNIEKRHNEACDYDEYSRLT